MSSGARANASGKAAEHILACILEYKGISINRQYIAGKNIYGGKLQIDIFIRNLNDFPHGLAIESKWQDVKGTADEKLPYLVANIKQCYPCPAVIVVHGGGIRSGAVRWAKSQVDNNLIAVYSLEEFMSWSLRKLL